MGRNGICCEGPLLWRTSEEGLGILRLERGKQAPPGAPDWHLKLRFMGRAIPGSGIEELRLGQLLLLPFVDA